MCSQASTPLDDGELQRREGLRLGLVEQEPELPAGRNSAGQSAAARHGVRGLGDGAPADEREHWRLESRLEEFLHRFGLTGDTSPASCSGGERKRAALALALALQPDLLLLDEPTNHLDIEAIERLEELLLKVPAAIVITHDRAFLDRVTTRIIELDRGVLRSYPGSFAAYEQRKDEELAAEDTARRRFEKFWQQEEVWIRKGVEARRTRNEGRVRRLERLRIERATRRDRLGNIRLTLNAGERSGDLVAELDGVSKSFAARPLIEGSLDADHARRSHRPHRSERRRQVDPDPPHSRRTRAGRRHGAARNPPEHRLLRSAASAARSRARPSPRPSVPARTGCRSAASASTS